MHMPRRHNMTPYCGFADMAAALFLLLDRVATKEVGLQAFLRLS